MNDVSTEPTGTLAPLPRTRHWLTRETVVPSHRARLLDAMAEAVATKGYGATTVADVVAIAGVSRRTFYEHYGDKEACFLAAFDAGLDFLLGEIEGALERLGEADWRMRAAVGIEAYLAGLTSAPALTRMFTIEALGAGPRARERRAAVLARWVAQWSALQRRARRQDPSIPEASNDRLLALVGGIEELVRDCLLTRGPERLPELAGAATAIAISTLAG